MDYLLSAAGNYGPGAMTVRAPGNADRVLAVGAYDIASGTLNSSSGRGPGMSRAKPEIAAPTNTTAASNVSATALQVFTGTSGATPYAAGAASLFKEFLVATGKCSSPAFADCAPGLLYAGVISSGDNLNAFTSNDVGAGKLQMPIPGCTTWLVGSVTLSHGQWLDVPYPLGATIHDRIKTAVWWPAYSNFPTLDNSDVDLYLLAPGSSTYAAVSASWDRGYEGVTHSVPGLPLTGTWTVRLNGYNLPLGTTRKVYIVGQAAKGGLCF